jgi:hypothetical protein
MSRALEGAPGSITPGEINKFKARVENAIQLVRFEMICF